MIRNIVRGVPSFVVALLLVSGANFALSSGLPVVAGMEAEYVEVRPDRVDARVTGIKLRGCSLVAGSAVGWYEGPTDVWNETPFEYIDDMHPESSRPSGLFRQNFGIWSWRKLPAHYQSLRTTVQHDCNGDVRTTISGTFNAPR